MNTVISDETERVDVIDETDEIGDLRERLARAEADRDKALADLEYTKHVVDLCEADRQALADERDAVRAELALVGKDLALLRVAHETIKAERDYNAAIVAQAQAQEQS